MTIPEWLHDVSGWIIVHKDHVTLLSGGVQAGTAAIVAFLTIFLWQENKRLRKAGTEPEVVAYLIPDVRHLHILMLVIANVGRGAAWDVSLEFMGDLESLQKKGARGLSPKLAHQRRRTVGPAPEQLQAGGRLISANWSTSGLCRSHYQGSGCYRTMPRCRWLREDCR